MIEVSEEVKKAYDKSTTQIDKIILEGKEYRITNIEYSDDCYDEGNIFGTAIAKILEFEIENSVDLEGKEFEYLTGVKVGKTIKWISLGKFITQDVEPNDTTNINKVIAVDYMLKSNIEYKSTLDYKSGEITILDVLKEGCKLSGLELGTFDFANKDFIVDSNQFAESTLIRQVFQAVAQISGTFAKIRRDNKLYFITPKMKTLLVKEVNAMTVADLNALPVQKISACGNNFSLNTYKELVIKRNTHPINLVSLGMSDIEGENITLRDEKSISKDGENSLVINDNPFAYTQEKREQLITALFDTVKGFEYTAYEIEGQAKPYAETGDEVIVVDKKGNVCNSFLFRFNYKSPKGLESQMSAPSIIKATVQYQNVPSALNIAKRTEIIVNKQEQTIKSIIQNQSETTNKLSEHTQTIDSMKDTLKSQETKIETVESKADTAQSTADTATTKADNAQTSANNAQSTANTANTNAQNAQKTADSNTTKITTTTTKLAEVEKTVDGITQSVSAVEEKVETVEDDLTTNYYNKTETNAQIQQKADSVTTTVTKQISTAKSEAIDSANASTDNKLKDYSTIEETKAMVKVANDNIELLTEEINTITGENNIVNGKFENDFSNWATSAEGGEVTVEEYGDEKYANLKTMYGATILSQEITGLFTDIDYDLSFYIFDNGNISISNNATFTVTIIQSKENSEESGNTLLQETINVSTTKQKVNLSFKLSEISRSVTIIFKLNTSTYLSGMASAMITDVILAGGTLSEKFAKINLTTDEISSEIAKTNNELTTAKSEIKQTTDEISSEVSKKVGENEIISKINQSAETVGIEADKIELTANDILNLISGNSINLTSKNITITSTGFSVDKNGKMTCSNANIVGGKIDIITTRSLGDKIIKVADDQGATSWIGTVNALIGASDPNDIYTGVYLQGGAGGQSFVMANTVSQTSLESQKKNFEKLKNGLDIINSTDIYKYNLKTQNDDDKKHIGFVIGKDYKYSSEITSVDENGKEVGVNLYSMIGVTYKAIQELSKKIENLEKGASE